MKKLSKFQICTDKQYMSDEVILEIIKFTLLSDHSSYYCREYDDNFFDEKAEELLKQWKLENPLYQEKINENKIC
jgi:hypothetical protein